MIEDKYFKVFPKLETMRLHLRNLNLDDASEVQLIRSNEKVMTYMDSNKHLTDLDSKNFISENLKVYEQGKGIFWAIMEKSSGDFIGDFAYHRIDVKNKRGEIGYTLKPDYWGRGYMQEAMVAVIRFGFNNLQLHSIEANINPENNNSRKLLRKVGFRKEAYFRENYYFNGEFLDSEIYSLLKSDFNDSTGTQEKP